MIDDLFVHMFKGLESRLRKEIDTVKGQFPYPEFAFLDRNPRITYKEGVQMLRDAGVEIGDFEVKKQKKANK